MSPEVARLASKIRLLLMDVDGVLTDGKLYNVPGPDGKMAETKGFDSQDGIALQWMARLGIATGLISGTPTTAGTFSSKAESGSVGFIWMSEYKI